MTNYLQKRFKLSDSSIATCVLPLCHTMGLNTQFLPNFLAGGKSIFHQSALSLGQLYRKILSSQGSFVGLISELLNFCFEEKIRRNLPPATFVKHLQLAGGVIRKEHLAMAKELFPNAVIHKGYGLTEAIRVSMIDSTDCNFLTDTAGYPLPEQEVKITDSNGNPLPDGMAGSLWIKGPNLMLGYENKKNPIKDGWLDSGDIAKIVDGRIEIIGRNDSIFKVKGERVSGKEIESLAREILLEHEVLCCLPINCRKNGVRPALFLQMGAQATLDFLQLRKRSFERELKRKFSESYKIPRDIFLLPELPRTANGKIARARLRELTENNPKFASELGKDKLGFRFFMVSEDNLAQLNEGVHE